MQCIRVKRGDSPASTPPSLSMESLDNYFERSLNRKSFLRRSFDLVRKNVVRHSHNLSRKVSKTGTTSQRSSLSIDDQNNNKRHSSASVTSLRVPANTYGGGRDSLVISTDCVISPSKSKKRRLRRLRKW